MPHSTALPPWKTSKAKALLREDIIAQSVTRAMDPRVIHNMRAEFVKYRNFCSLGGFHSLHANLWHFMPIHGHSRPFKAHKSCFTSIHGCNEINQNIQSCTKYRANIARFSPFTWSCCNQEGHPYDYYAQAVPNRIGSRTTWEPEALSKYSRVPFFFRTNPLRMASTIKTIKSINSDTKDQAKVKLSETSKKEMNNTNTSGSQGSAIAKTPIQESEDDIVVAPATVLDTHRGDSDIDTLVETHLYVTDSFKGTLVAGTSTTHTSIQDSDPFQERPSYSDGENLPTANAPGESTKQYRQDIFTSDELLFRMKQNRKAATVNSGLWGGVLGLLLFGPIGAVGVGVGSAVITKHSMKRREKKVRKKLQQRLNPPRIVDGIIC